jgi:DNA-binding response OmpR family regulator
MQQAAKKKVFLVDDDVDLVATMNLILTKAGYDVKYQHDDKNIEENVRTFNPDLIILDVMFPADDGAGFRIARALRHHDGLKEKPILMLSAVNQEGSFVGKFSDKDIDEVYLPITKFLEKPLDAKRLTEQVARMIVG